MGMMLIIRLTEEQRDRLLSVDLHVLDVKPIKSASKPISHAAKAMTMDEKVDSLIAFYYQPGRWPPRKEVDPVTGLPLGLFLSEIKQGGSTLTEEQRDRLLTVDSHVLHVKHRSRAANSMNKDQKIDSLIAFYHNSGRRWPKRVEVDPLTAGLRLGHFLSDIKRARLTPEQRDCLLSMDPHVLNVKPISKASKTIAKDQKLTPSLPSMTSIENGLFGRRWILTLDCSWQGFCTISSTVLLN